MADFATAEQRHRPVIEALIAEQVDAWNRGDAAGFAARTLPDVVFTNIVGMFSVGRAPFVAQHQHIFSTIYRGSRLEQTIVQITLVRPDIAIVDTLTTLRGYATLLGRRYRHDHGPGHAADLGAGLRIVDATSAGACHAGWVCGV